MFAPLAASALMKGAALLPMILPSERFSSTTIPTCAGCGIAAAARPTRGSGGVAPSPATAAAPTSRSARYALPVNPLGPAIRLSTRGVYGRIWPAEDADAGVSAGPSPIEAGSLYRVKSRGGARRGPPARADPADRVARRAHQPCRVPGRVA